MIFLFGVGQKEQSRLHEPRLDHEHKEHIAHDQEYHAEDQSEKKICPKLKSCVDTADTDRNEERKRNAKEHPKDEKGSFADAYDIVLIGQPFSIVKSIVLVELCAAQEAYLRNERRRVTNERKEEAEDGFTENKIANERDDKSHEHQTIGDHTALAQTHELRA